MAPPRPTSHAASGASEEAPRNVDPAIEALLKVGRTLIPALTSKDDFAKALGQNASEVSGLLTACAALGGAMAAPTIYTAFQHPLWRIAASVGLVSPPAWVPVAGGVAGMAIVGGALKKRLDAMNYDTKVEIARLAYHAAAILAAGASHIALDDHLAGILDDFNLDHEDVAQIKSSAPKRAEDLKVGNVAVDLRPHILMTAATVGDKAYWHGNLSHQFHIMAGKLGVSPGDATHLRNVQREQTAAETLSPGLLEQAASAFHHVEPSQAAIVLEVIDRLRPQKQRLETALNTGSVVTTIIATVLAMVNQQEIGTVIGETWKACRSAARGMVRSDVDRGFEMLAEFLRADLVSKGE